MTRPEWNDAAEQSLRARAKEELRQRMRAVRRVMPSEACAARSTAIGERLRSLPEFESARVVVGYTAFRKEADPVSILRAAESAGKIVGLVRVEADGRLGLHQHHDGEPLLPNEYGIDEPAPDAARIAVHDVDLIIIPALAVDGRGYRIGFGQGYYDRLLPTLPHAFKVVIAYDFQLLLETPFTHGDVACDCVVTDQRTLSVAADA
jgi:5-formyltetrahydrofolate cyclo-ligase